MNASSKLIFKVCMKIKTKMLLGGGCLAAIPVLIGCYFLGMSAINTGKASLEEDAKQSLIAIRDITASEITSYISNIEKQALSLSENLMVVDHPNYDLAASYDGQFIYFSQISSGKLIEKVHFNDLMRGDFSSRGIIVDFFFRRDFLSSSLLSSSIGASRSSGGALVSSPCVG